MAEINLQEYSKQILDIVQDGVYRNIIRVGEATSFLMLKDTPDSYAGYAGYYIGVNATEDGVTYLSAGVDEKAKVSANDNTAGYLNGKLVSGNGITLTENNNGLNETLSIANADLGSSAVATHESSYDHSLLHAAATVAAAPLTISGQQITFNYDANDFQLSGNNLQIKDSGIDHGSIGGLGDDDHSQYLTSGRADTWLATKTADNLTEGATNKYYTDEKVDDRVAALIQNGTGISWTYSDIAGTLTPAVSITQYTDELAQDAIGTILDNGTVGDINFTYDDATPKISGVVKNDSITFAKMQNITTARVLGRTTASTGDVEELSAGAGISIASSQIICTITQYTDALAIAAVLPTQTGHGGEYLQTNGSVVSWAAPAGSGTVNSGLAGHLAYYPSATTAVDDLAFGTANQILGMNAAADAYEHKTMTEGEGIDIAHGVGTITFSCEDASTTNKGIAELATDAETLAGTDTGRVLTPSNLEYARSVTGWTPITDTFTYASATTINVASGAASKYSVGDKLRFQNNDSGTYLYAYVITIADTLLTVVGDAVPNATLTDAYYSKIENPQGFPQYFSWTPSIGNCSPNPTFTYAYFYLRGRACTIIWRGNGNGTKNGTGTWTMTGPIASKSATTQDGWFVMGYYGANVNMYLWAMTGTTTITFSDAYQATLSNFAAANFGTGNAVGFANITNQITYLI